MRLKRFTSISSMRKGVILLKKQGSKRITQKDLKEKKKAYKNIEKTVDFLRKDEEPSEMAIKLIEDVLFSLKDEIFGSFIEM